MRKKSAFSGKSGESWFMLSFWLIPFVLFTLIPVGISVAVSFTNYNMLQPARFLGIANYLRMFLDDDIFIKSLSNTLLFALVTGPVGYVLSFAAAWFINDFSKGTRGALTFLFYSPSMVGSVYVIWTYLFSNDSYGVINSFLLSANLLREPIYWLTDPSYNFYVVVIVVLWMSMGNGFLAFVAGLKQLNPVYYESASIDGLQNRWQELWYITLPQMTPQLLIGAVLSVSSAFAIGAQNAALTGNPSTDYSTHTLLLHILDHGTQRLEMGYASAVAVVLFTIMLGSWALISRGLRAFSGKERGCTSCDQSV
ncbi:MAG: sugar ABC transporter permease [Oscillospiraceae bacterium]|jgi:multiple sugar transport system permease protein|nr:sugar ABC transporter permease [Oscillospiraceae bacterium]